MSPDAARITAVVVSFNTRDDTLQCLRSLRRGVPGPCEVIVVDNGSRDGSAQAVADAAPEALVLPLPANVGYAAASNHALRRVRTPYALLLNSDAEAGPGAVDALAAYLDAHPRVALAGPRTLNPDGSAQISWGPRLTPFNEWRHRRWRRATDAGDPRARARVADLAGRERAPDWLSGACLLGRIDALRQVGFFDEGYFLYEEDADLCLRLRRAGWELAFVPQAAVLHHGGRSTTSAPLRSLFEYHRSHLRYYVRHNGPFRSALLRAWLLGRAAYGWLLARRAHDVAADRRLWRALAGLALGATDVPPRN